MIICRCIEHRGHSSSVGQASSIFGDVRSSLTCGNNFLSIDGDDMIILRASSKPRTPSLASRTKLAYGLFLVGAKAPEGIVGWDSRIRRAGGGPMGVSVRSVLTFLRLAW